MIRAILDDGLTVLAYPVRIHGQRAAGCTTANFDDLRCNAVPAPGSALGDVWRRNLHARGSGIGYILGVPARLRRPRGSASHGASFEQSTVLCAGILVRAKAATRIRQSLFRKSPKALAN